MRTRLLQHLQKKTTWFKSIVALTCLLLTSASAFAQTKTVTGTVTDAANEPLIGASVLVQGTSTGTITDMDGKYSISVTPDDVLAFSYVGMTSQSVIGSFPGAGKSAASALLWLFRCGGRQGRFSVGSWHRSPFSKVFIRLQTFYNSYLPPCIL